MKSTDFASALSALATALKSAGLSQANHLDEFAKAFTVSASQTLGKRVEELQRLSWSPSPDLKTPTLGYLDQLISPRIAITTLIGNTTTNSECAKLRSFLRDHGSTSLERFLEVATAAPKVATRSRNTKSRSKPTAAKPVRQDLVDRYFLSLKTAMLDANQFSAIFEQLKGDPEITLHELSALAKVLTGSGAKSPGAALTKIIKKHQAHMTQLKRAQRVRGRSAA